MSKKYDDALSLLLTPIAAKYQN